MRGVPVYGIRPHPVGNGAMVRMHGGDEHMAIEALDPGTEWVYCVLLDVAGR
jgi:acetylornithine deacetylase/succinyl-diaminopimelate desuccinylase-like protein